MKDVERIAFPSCVAIGALLVSALLGLIDRQRVRGALVDQNTGSNLERVWRDPGGPDTTINATTPWFVRFSTLLLN